MKKIIAFGGEEILVSNQDYKWLSSYRWYINGRGYVLGWVDGKSQRMHRLIACIAKGMDVDHIDGNKLNNQRLNLRVCTHAENCRNNKLSIRNKTGAKGVYKRKNGNFSAIIQNNGKQLHLGTYSSLQAAADAYDRAAITLHGKFARLNSEPI